MKAFALTDTPMTVDEFEVWLAERDDDIKYELLDGYVVPKYGEFANGEWHNMGRDRVGHNRTKRRAANALQAAAREAGLGCEAFVDGVQVRLPNERVRIPDAILDCGAPDDSSAFAAEPVVVVEVISPSSTFRDENIKLWEYFQIPSVQHYLILSEADRRLVVHSRRAFEDNAYDTRLLTQGTVRLDPPGLELSVTDVFGDRA